MISLLRGQKIKLAEISSTLQLKATLDFDATNLKFDFSCFGLDENGQLSDDRYFIFYNQKQSPENALRLEYSTPREAQFEIDLARLPKTVNRLVFVATVDGNGQMSELKKGRFVLNFNGRDLGEFAFTGTDFSVEKAIMVSEIYFKSEWRVAANGQGFKEGLDAILKRFGGEIQAETVLSPAPPRPVPQTPAPRPNPAGESCCVRCGKSEGLLGQWLGINALDRSTKRCVTCEREVKAAFDGLRADFGMAWQNGVLSTSLWTALWTRFDNARTGSSRSQALEFLRPDALRFMERLVTMAASDGVITSTEESYIRQICKFLELPSTMQAPFLARLEHVKEITKIREGHLPQISPGDTHLDAGEICHLNVGATYHKVNTRSVNQIPGRLMATSKKLIFLSTGASGGWTIQFKNIMSTQSTANSVQVELSTRSGNGYYSVKDSQWCEAVITTLTRMAKRQLLSPQSDNPTRHIPQDVKNAVWQRDGGQCMQCKANSYLEFDHVIPHSKGGANTVGNVQLLCRACNGTKGNRI